MRKGGEEVRPMPCISGEILQPDSETKNDGEIKRGRLLHSRIKLEGSDVKTCHAFHLLPPEFPFVRRLWLLHNVPVHAKATAVTGWMLHTGGHHSPGELSRASSLEHKPPFLLQTIKDKCERFCPTPAKSPLVS